MKIISALVGAVIAPYLVVLLIVEINQHISTDEWAIKNKSGVKKTDWKHYRKMQLIIPYSSKAKYPNGMGQITDNGHDAIKTSFGEYLEDLRRRFDFKVKKYEIWSTLNNGPYIVQLKIDNRGYRELFQSNHVSKRILQSKLNEIVCNLMWKYEPELMRQYTSQ